MEEDINIEVGKITTITTVVEVTEVGKITTKTITMEVEVMAKGVVIIGITIMIIRAKAIKDRGRTLYHNSLVKKKTRRFKEMES